MEIVSHNNKDYSSENGDWFGLNKNQKKYKVSSKNLIKLLNEKSSMIDLEDTSNESEQKLKSEGLGDIISNVTKSLGIEECEGCKKKKKKLNHLFNWLNKTRELTDDESDFIKDLSKRKSMNRNESKRLFSLYNEITNSKLKRCICGGLHIKMIQRLLKFTN